MARGELEITDLDRLYMEAGEFVRTIQYRQGVQIARIEEIAYLQGFITADQARAAASGSRRPPMAA